MEKVRFGVIGIGQIGTYHVKNLLQGKIENGTLGAVCDINPERIEWVHALGSDGSMPSGAGVSAFSDYREMYASGLIDAAIVAVPHYLHPKMTIDGLQAGLHMVTEKPAGVYTKQVKEMNAAAEKSDKLFSLMFNQRTNCVYRRMRELVHDGTIGEVKRVNWIITTWYRAQSYYDSGSWRATWKGEGGGVLFNQSPHQLDLLQWVLGMMPDKVRSFCHFGKWHNIEVEDDVTVYMEFPNGATGVFVTSTADAPGTNRFEILGTKGKLVCEGETLKLTMLDTDEREFCYAHDGGQGQPTFHDVPVETDGKNPQHVGILNNFANAVLGIEPLFVDGREGLNGVELMDSMLLSTWLDKEITLPIDDELYLSELEKRISESKSHGESGILLDANNSLFDNGKV
ncbi:MAG: Gfo/Idh/MocA family oxidoreductase [Clostridia bacterium]|nr:Gfo/Idh/MocA family oxidoreductase [Clostridia bacterium]